MKKQQIIFLHGWCGNAEHFCEQEKMFSQEYEVLALAWYKLFGDKLDLSKNLVHQVTQLIVEYLQAHQVQNPILVGHSMGGVLALDIAERLNFPVKGLALLDTALTKAPEKISYYHELITDLLNNLTNKQRLYDFFMQAFVLPFDNQEIMDKLAKEAVTAVNVTWLHLLKDAILLDKESVLKRCLLPLLFVGSSVPFTSLKKIKTLNPTALTAQVVASGHFVMQNASVQINAMLARFFNLAV